MIAKVLLYCNENIGKCTRSTRSHDAPLNQSENAPLQRRASKKMIFYSTLSGLPTNFISFYTSASRCPTIFLYRLSGKIEGPLLTVLRPYYAQKTERTSSYLTLHSFFLVCSSQECRKQAFVNIMCI